MTITCCAGYTPNYLGPGAREIRGSGAYAKTKIEAFMRYAVSAQQVFKSNKARVTRAGQPIAGKLVYLEPFSGPGWNLIRESGERVKGTPLRAIEELGHFDIFIFNELDQAKLDSLYSELRDRGLSEAENPAVYLFRGNANDLIDRLPDVFQDHLVPACYPQMGIAAVDPEGLHFHWGSVAKLAGHRLDFVCMVATHIDLVRNANNADAEEHIERWLGEPLRGRSAGDLIKRYEERLKSVARYSWCHGVSTSPIPGDEDVWVKGEYHLIFSSHCSNDVASKIWKGVCRQTRRETHGPSLFEGID